MMAGSLHHGWAHYDTKRAFTLDGGGGGQSPSRSALRWLQDPQAVEPGTAMPDLGVSPAVARDMAAYLYTLR